MRKFNRVFFKRFALVTMAVGMMVMFTGCGASDSSDYKSQEAMATNSASGTVYAEDSYAYAEYATTDGLTMGTDSGSANSLQTVDSSRKLIKTVNMNVETQDFEQLMTTIQTQVTELGGYIENMNTYNGSAYSAYRTTRSSDMTIRIPKNQLDSFLNTVSGISNVVRRTDSVEDITLTYVDLESHRDVLEAEQERLLEFLAQAETVEDMITLESRLSDVRYQLESMESQLRTFDNQVDYSTVYLTVEEVEVLTPVEEETTWERISNGFAESLDNVGKGFVEFGIWFVVNLPYMIVVSVLIAAFTLVLYVVIKRATGPKKGKKQQTVEQEKK